MTKSSDDAATPAERRVREAADIADLTFELQTTWRSVLPRDPPDNALVHRRVEFNSDPTVSTANQFDRTTASGTAASVGVSSGAATLTNSGAERAADHFAFTGRPPEPHFSTLLRITEQSGGGRPALGLQTPNGGVAVTLASETETGTTGAVEGENEAPLWTFAGAPEAPYDVLVTWLGTVGIVLTRPVSEQWTCHGRFAWDGDPYADWENSTARPWWGCDLPTNASVSVKEVSLLSTAGFGVRDPALVTRRDGRPLQRGRHVYLACTAGAPGYGYSYQCVFRLHVDTFDVELTGVLFADTQGGSRYPDNAAHAVYDDLTDEFVVMFSGFGTKHLGPDDEVATYVGRSDRNLLDGVHAVAVEQAHLPTRSQVWDPFVVYDESAGAWRCTHTYDGAGAVAVSETTDESLTDGWELCRVFEDANEGTKFVPVADGYCCTYTDQRQPTGMAVSDYPQIGRNAAPIDVRPPTEDTFDSGFTSHPMIVPVDEGGEMRYLLVGFDGSEFAGLDVGGNGAKRTRGSLYVYEAE